MQQMIWVALLLAFVISSALPIIYVQHERRDLFADLRHDQKKQPQEIIAW